MQNIGDIFKRRGFFTTQLYLQGQTLREIESRLGFHAGRLNQGAIFATAMSLPKPEEFEFAGYSQVAGHHTKKQYGDINSPATESERKTHLQNKQRIINTVWGLRGENRLIKVIPSIDHSSHLSDDVQYPPGTGIPQWKIIVAGGVSWQTICNLKGYPDSKFIPNKHS